MSTRIACETHLMNNEEDKDCSLCIFTKNDTLENIKRDLDIVKDCKAHLDDRTYTNIILHMKKRTELSGNDWTTLYNDTFTSL